MPTDKKVTVLGTIGNNAFTGERQITADSVWVSTENAAISPLGINGFLIGGAVPENEPYTQGVAASQGLYNTGLLVRVLGKVRYVGDDYLYIDEGSTSKVQDGNTRQGPIAVPLNGNPIPTQHPEVKGLRIYFGSLNKPGIGDYISITGISSTTQFQPDQPIIRCIRVRSQDDIAYYDRYITGRRVASGIVDTSDVLIPIGSKVRMPDDMVFSVYSENLQVMEMGWQLHYVYAINPAQTQLQYGDTVTICGTYTTSLGLWGFPEFAPAHIYLGGSTYGAMSIYPGDTSGMMSFASAETAKIKEPGGGTFRPWPCPTAEEILASESFQSQYNAVGAIGWVLSQPDGAMVDLSSVAISGLWYDGRVLGLREWFEPIPHGPGLFLYLDQSIELDTHLKDMVTVDIVGGKLITLPDGTRAITKPEAVYAYTDAEGRLMLPSPWPKHTGRYSIANNPGEWPWKVKVAP